MVFRNGLSYTGRRMIRLLLVAICFSDAASTVFAKAPTVSAQLVGTVMEGRHSWNLYDLHNEMLPDSSGNFIRTLSLSATGGRNRDGIYAMRFFTGHDLRSVYKRSRISGQLVSGRESAFADNIIFQVPEDGIYQVLFNPALGTYSITPHTDELTTINSLQVNGFVHDTEDAIECFDGNRTRPAEKWDEWVPAHEFTRKGDGSWTITLPLSVKGGHEKNGVYQCLFSANHNSDWGYSAILGKPGRLAGGNGYDSRVGHIEESAVVFRVTSDGNYTITVWPDTFRFTISPTVEYYRAIEFQVNGDVVMDPWNPKSPDHQMVKEKDGIWSKKLQLSTTGGSLGNGLYTMNFSIDGDWALDSIGFGGLWGKSWHSAPQEWNLLFRVERADEYLVTLDPFKGTFAIEPPVKPMTRIESLQISGDFEIYGKEGWNPVDPGHDMVTLDGHRYTKDLVLASGVTYSYKYTANRAGWSWSLVDYPYDGYRRLAPHGNPPALQFTSPRNGLYRFTADTESGDYSVNLIKLR